jgi:hypothetical protein
MTHLTEQKRFARSEDGHEAFQNNADVRIFTTTIAGLSLAWFSMFACCVYQIGVLAFN